MSEVFFANKTSAVVLLLKNGKYVREQSTIVLGKELRLT